MSSEAAEEKEFTEAELTGEPDPTPPGEGFSDESIRTMIGSSGKDAPKFFKVLAKLTSAPILLAPKPLPAGDKAGSPSKA